jgi:hypothetical protein
MKNSINSCLISALLIFAIFPYQYAASGNSDEGVPSVASHERLETGEMRASEEVKISGEYMKAFLAAYKAFENDPSIVPRKKHIENYSIQFTEEETVYSILFFAKRLPRSLSA